MTLRLLSLAAIACVFGQPAFANQSCGYERAFSVDRGTLHREGDVLVIHVRGQAPGPGWSEAKLAAVPGDTGPKKLAFRLIACEPSQPDSDDLSELTATAYVIVEPGVLHDIVIRSATNELHLHEDQPDE